MMTDEEVRFMKLVITETDFQTRKRLIDAECLRIETARVVLVREEHKPENIRARYEEQVRRQQAEEQRHRQQYDEENRQRYTEQLRLKNLGDAAKRPLTSTDE